MDEAYGELRRDLGNFIDADLGASTYTKKLEAALEAAYDADKDIVKDVRLNVDVQDLQDFSSDLYRRLIHDPAESLPAFEDAVRDQIVNNDERSKMLRPGQRVHVGLVGEFGPNHVSPRQILSSFINQVVEVYGIVTKVTAVRPKMLKSVHYAEISGKYTTREYRDATSFRGAPTGSAVPTRDDDNNILTTMYGCCEFINYQSVVIQELPETAPAGQLPRSTEIVLEHDLVNTCKPGDRIAVVGVYRAYAGKVSGTINGLFRAVVIANSVQQLRKEVTGPEMTTADVEAIWKLAKQPNWLDHLASSLAPSIYGYQLIKKALALLLLGGREHNLPNGTHLRGDINCLLIGDPGVAKSQLLRAIMNLAPLAVSTTGRGSSGVGLTAAITTSSDTGERQLEAGAMVLADRGVVCIDEFDKMGDNDRVAVHEVMEQQTVTIAKAGIHTSLHARCSVLAAANPLYGTYDHSLSVTKNINLPDSLLSRFDLLFVVLDHMDPARDQAIAEHVVQQHLYRPPGDDGRTPVNESVDYRHELDAAAHTADDAEGQGIYVKYNPQLYGPRTPGMPDPLSVPFMKKFFHFAKGRFSNVQLTQEANEQIADYYTELRATSGDRALPVTVRSLETIVRLASAHAKCRLSNKVEAQDVDVAREILDAVMASRNGQVAPGQGWERRPKKGAKRGARDDDEPISEDEDEEVVARNAAQRAAEDGPGDVVMADAQEDGNDENADPNAQEVSGLPGFTKGQLQAVGEALRECFLTPSEILGRPVSDVQGRLAAKGVQFTEEQMKSVLSFLDQESLEGRFGVPFTYDVEHNIVYDMS